ncbi:hypothetical protein ECG_00420 [Echinococcus granulosus]|nr:hypothetical protein ECG_00420 [Echinococcus granulosus]
MVIYFIVVEPGCQSESSACHGTCDASLALRLVLMEITTSETPLIYGQVQSSEILVTNYQVKHLNPHSGSGGDVHQVSDLSFKTFTCHHHASLSECTRACENWNVSTAHEVT